MFCHVAQLGLVHGALRVRGLQVQVYLLAFCPFVFASHMSVTPAVATHTISDTIGKASRRKIRDGFLNDICSIATPLPLKRIIVD